MSGIGKAIARRGVAIAMSRSTRARVSGLLLLATTFGGLLDLLGLSEVLPFVWGLFYVGYGVFLRDVAQALAQGSVDVPRYPGGFDIWGVALPSLLFGLLAASLWFAPLLFAPPVALLLGAGAAILTCLVVALGGPGLPPAGEGRVAWLVGASMLGSLGTGCTWLLGRLATWAALFAPVSLLSGLLVVVLAAAISYESA